MWNWLRRPSGVQPAAAEPTLRGAPLRARVKAYSAESGYVYQYVYAGFLEQPDATDFSFKVTADRVRTDQVVIRLFTRDIVALEAEIGRTLLRQEHYAIAKLSLFEAFDSGALNSPVLPGQAEMRRYLETLGRA